MELIISFAVWMLIVLGIYHMGKFLTAWWGNYQNMKNKPRGEHGRVLDASQMTSVANPRTPHVNALKAKANFSFLHQYGQWVNDVDHSDDAAYLLAVESITAIIQSRHASGNPDLHMNEWAQARLVIDERFEDYLANRESRAADIIKKNSEELARRARYIHTGGNR